MKTFDDLIFKSLHNGVGAKLNFPNGYGVSVVQHQWSYTDGPNEYELGVLKDGKLCYDTPITGDVEGHLKKDEVTEIMRKVQELPESVKVNSIQ